MSSSDTGWFKSSKSGGNGGSCVETRRHDGKVEVRDSKDRTGPVLVFTRDVWADFMAGVKEGAFDLQ
jgi:hypothetical protein